MARAHRRARADRWAAWTVSLRDYRKLIELGEPGAAAYIGLSIEDPTRARPINLEVNLDGVGIVLMMDESETGELFDSLAQVLRELLTAQTQHKLHTDTPRGDGPVSDGSASIHDRG